MLTYKIKASPPATAAPITPTLSREAPLEVSAEVEVAVVDEFAAVVLLAASAEAAKAAMRNLNCIFEIKLS